MQDVIFSGTENRKPLSYASVAITLNNADHKLPVDYEEVTVTRKLYRSGESEYLINGTACRLKDINEMFYDTGIGKEGYSIIGQGQIDKILSGKPEERRELFDEAAGIVKFKRRKNISLKKLEEERANLTRVNDILSELEKQVGPLKKQSETAREYLKKKEELKTYDINMFLLETERLKEQMELVDGQLKTAEGELQEANVRYEEMKAEYEAVEKEIEEAEVLIEKARTQLNETTLLKQQLEGLFQSVTKHDLPFCRGFQPEKHFYKSTFPGTIFADDTKILPGADLKIKVVHHDLPFVCRRHSITPDQCHTSNASFNVSTFCHIILKYVSPRSNCSAVRL